MVCLREHTGESEEERSVQGSRNNDMLTQTMVDVDSFSKLGDPTMHSPCNLQYVVHTWVRV